MVNITAKSTYFKELLFPFFKIFYALIVQYYQLHWLNCCKRQISVVTLMLQTNMMQYSG